MVKKICCLTTAVLVFLNIILAIPVEAAALRVDAVSAIAIDNKTGMVLFDQNGHKVIPMASTTKIITALVVLEYGNLNQEVEISSNAASIRGSKVGYKAGEKITIRELLYGLMLKSGNDCAIALAEGISGSVAEFCKVMNEYAVTIGILDSHFESPHGLDSQNHYSSAYDLAMATRKAKEHSEFTRIVATKNINSEEGVQFTREFNNINKLLYQEPSCTGVKTGYTGQAGKCLVSSFKIDENEIIVVTLNCTPRWRESQKIYEYVKENYQYNKLYEAGKVLGEVHIRGSEKLIPLTLDEDIIVPVKEGENMDIHINIPEYPLNTPLSIEDSIGNISIVNELHSHYVKCLHPLENIERPGIIERIKNMFD